MAKLATLAVGAVVVTSAAWSGGWFYGEREIRAGLDTEIAKLAQQGVAASYKSLEIEGFPFGYKGRIVEPKTQAVTLLGRIPTRTDWAAPWVSFDTSVSDFGVINFKFPDTQTVRLTPVNGGPVMDVAIQTSELGGRVEQSGGRASFTVAGNSIEISATSQAIVEPVFIAADTVQFLASAPVAEPGQITSFAELSGLTANDGVWDFVDPGERFPRDRANIRLAIQAATVARPDRSLALKNLTVEHIAANIAGVEVTGEGQATVENRRPDGALTLSFAGLGGFFDNAVAAGYVPEQQAAIYRIMLDSYARKGANPGDQVFEVGFKDGYVFVNDSPTFVPAPLLP